MNKSLIIVFSFILLAVACTPTPQSVPTPSVYQQKLELTATKIYQEAGNPQVAKSNLVFRVITDKWRIGYGWNGVIHADDKEPGFLYFDYIYGVHKIKQNDTAMKEMATAATSAVADAVCALREAGFNEWTIIPKIGLEISAKTSLERTWCINQSDLQKLNCDNPSANAIWSTPVSILDCTLNNQPSS